MHRTHTASEAAAKHAYLHDEVLVNRSSRWLVRHLTRSTRRYLVGPAQRWVFEAPSADWNPPVIQKTSLYLHVPFCRHFCPYCPYTKVPFDKDLTAFFTRAAVAEVDWWADRIGRAEITSIYIGGGTPTLAMDSVASVVNHIRKRFHLTGDICIETNPGDVDRETVQRLHDVGVKLISLGVQSFRTENLDVLGRDYDPKTAERALSLLTGSNFASVNADIMFALPRQTTPGIIADLTRAVDLGANQITTYPLFTFPYSSVGEHLRLSTLQMPKLSRRREQYRSISEWFSGNGFERVSVWGFKSGKAPRYSSVTRDGYIGIGPGAGSHLPDCFVLNTFHLDSWIQAMRSGRSAVALRLPFLGEMSAWWWLYWRFYDTRVPLKNLNLLFGRDAPKARRLLKLVERNGLAFHSGDCLELTEKGSFWLHLVQNYFALNYVNTLWTQARKKPWPDAVPF